MSMNSTFKSLSLKTLQWSFLILVNCLALFLIVNVCIWGFYRVTEIKTSSERAGKTPLRYKQSNEEVEKLFPQLSKQDVEQLIKDSRRIFQEYDSFTQFREAPYKTRFVNVDLNGFRHSKNQSEWPPIKKDPVIFFFGGSTTFGYGVPDFETVPSHLQDILANKMGGSVKIFNFGRANYFSSQERALFQKLLLDGHVPDLAIFMDGINEFILFNGEPAYTNELKSFMNERDIPLSRRITRELPVVKFVNSHMSHDESKNVINDRSKNAAPQESQSEILNGVIQRYRSNRKIIEAIAREYGIKTLFVWQPMPLYAYDTRHHIFSDYNYSAASPYLKIGYDLMASANANIDSGANFIWLADIQREESRPLYVSAFHYSPEMSRIIANYIAQDIIKRKLLVPTSDGPS